MRTRMAAVLSAATLAVGVALVVPTATVAAAVGCSSCTAAPDGVRADARADARAEEFVVSEAQFNQMFPNRNAFYTYS